MKFVVAKEQCRLDIVFDSFELFKLFATKNQNLFSRFYIWVFFVWAELVNLFFDVTIPACPILYQFDCGLWPQ